MREQQQQGQYQTEFEIDPSEYLLEDLMEDEGEPEPKVKNLGGDGKI